MAEHETDAFYFELDVSNRLIGPYLPNPSAVATLNGTAAVGVSPYVAREDHAHDLVKVTIGAANSRNLDLTALDGTNEGGRILWRGAGAYSDWTQNVYQNLMRFFIGANILLSISDIGIVTAQYGFSHPNYFHITKNATQSLTSATPANILWQTESNDPNGLHNTGANTDRVTMGANSYGYWEMFATIPFATGSATGAVSAKIARYNSSAVLQEYFAMQEMDVGDTAASAKTLCPAGGCYFNSGDFAVVEATQSSGGALNVLATAHMSGSLKSR